MIRETIEKIEKRIESSNSVKSKDKQELLKLLSTLEAEIVSLFKNPSGTRGKHYGLH